jgi:hypothetical protein
MATRWAERPTAGVSKPASKVANRGGVVTETATAAGGAGAAQKMVHLLESTELNQASRVKPQAVALDGKETHHTDGPPT